MAHSQQQTLDSRIAANASLEQPARQRVKSAALYTQTLHRLQRSTTALFGLGMLLVLVLVAVFADVLAPYSPILNDPTATFLCASGAWDGAVGERKGVYRSLSCCGAARPPDSPMAHSPQLHDPHYCHRHSEYCYRHHCRSLTSFLGLGTQPPTPSWGWDLKANVPWIQMQPWLAVGPGCTIFITVLSFNLFGDGLRDALDPRLK